MQRPRVALVPRASSSDADDAIFLATSYELPPDEWQEYVLEGWLGVLPGGKWAAPRCGLAVARQNGKNGCLEVRELFGMVMLGERFLHTAHEVKTARKAFVRLLYFFDNPKQFPDLHKLVSDIRKTNGQEAILLHNGGSVEFVARSKGSGRGFTVDVLVLDEAQDLTDEEQAALLPTISASPNPQTILMGTPPGASASGEVFARVRAAGVEGVDRRLCWMEWGCEAPEGGTVDLDDVANWALGNPAYNIRLAHDTIADERAQMDDETFGRERLGMWALAGGTSALDLDRWRRLAVTADSPKPRVDGPVAFAVDVSPARSSAAIGAAGFLSDGRPYVDVLEHGKGVTWAVKRLVELHAKWAPVAVVVDGAGPAGSLIAALREAGIEVVVTAARDMAQACGGFFDAAEAGAVLHKGQPNLNAAIGAARKRPLGDAFGWQRKDPVTDITPLVAVTLALHGLVTAGMRKTKRKRTGKVW